MHVESSVSPRSKPHPLVESISALLLADGERDRLVKLPFADRGHGYDRFGLNPRWVALGAALVRPLYDDYFRVISHGAHHLPRSGPTIVVANHSGSIPVDAAMLWLDILRHTHPARVPRPVMDHFVRLSPFVNVLFSRIGAIGGARGDVERLLADGELLMIFPEGTTGIGKNFRHRYRLQDWRVGHAELAIRARAKIVPAAVIGAEEQFVQLTTIRRGASLLGVPFIPVPLSPLPLPVRYHVHYGEPIELADRYPDPDDPFALELAALETKEAVESLIAAGLSHRSGVFS